jgi:hypothetical protein
VLIQWDFIYFVLLYIFTSFFFILPELLGIVDRPDIFSYGELRTATEAFNASNILGEGGYGPVYKVFALCCFFTVLFCACEKKEKFYHPFCIFS